MDERQASSAMGPSSEPGDAHPVPADQAQGLGGIGTEGKPGPPEGGSEPQLPHLERLVPERLKRLAARAMQREKMQEEAGQKGTLRAADQRAMTETPPMAIPATGNRRQDEAGPVGGTLYDNSTEELPPRQLAGGGAPKDGRKQHKGKT